jgi:midasin
MSEVAKEKLEAEVLGNKHEIDCHIEYGQDIDTSVKVIDGWILPLIEMKRVTDARNALVLESHDYYTVLEDDSTRPIHPSEVWYPSLPCNKR